MRKARLVVALALAACGFEPRPMPAHKILRPELSLGSRVQAMAPPRVEVAHRDPYASAENWCHEVDDLLPCRRGSACSPDPRTGRERVCINPWWVPGDERLCVPRTQTKAELSKAAMELAGFVSRVCRQPTCDPEALTKLMRIVSWREVRHDPRWTHLLVGDQDAAFAAWRRKRKTYAGNPHYAESWRWRSRGYGQIPALHLHRFDKFAPPEALCNRVIASETYLETLRSCYGGVAQKLGAVPTWYDLHRCASGGKYSRPASISQKGGFVGRAKSVGLDPFAPVSRAGLGRPIAHDMETVSRIEVEIQASLGVDSVPESE